MDVERMLERLDRSGLDSGARAAVLDALTAGMGMPMPNNERTAYNRRQYRTAASWMRKAARVRPRRSV